MVARTRFKYDSDFLVACALVAELPEANAHLLVEYADAQDLGQDQAGDRSVSKRALGAGCTSRLGRGHLYLPQH